MSTKNSFNKIFTDQPRWRFVNEPLSKEPDTALLRDSALLKEVAIAKRGAMARLWEVPQCLVVTRKETRFPDFTEACNQLSQIGWPVIVRASGGTTVPLHAGILNFSLIFPQTTDSKYDLDQIYLALCEPLKRALKRLNLSAEYGETPGSYCDGRYNLNIKGLKVTGTAQKLMVSPPNHRNIKQGVLAQAMLMVEADAAAGTNMVNMFYQLSGNSRRFDPDVAVSIQDIIDCSAYNQAGQLTATLRQLIAEEFLKLTGDSIPQ